MPFRTHNMGLFVLVPCARTDRLRPKKNSYLPKQTSLALTVVVLCLLDDVIRERVSKKLLKEFLPYKVYLFV